MTIPHNKITTLPENEITERYLKGESVNILSQCFKVSRNVIWRILKDKKVKIRGRAEAEIVKWSKMSIEQRSHQYAAAHLATKGKKIPLDVMKKMAKTLQSTKARVGKNEYNIIKFLEYYGYQCSSQHAIDIYNIDIFVENTIPVEINSHSCDPLKKPNDRKKIIDLLKKGFHVIYVVFSDIRYFQYSFADKELIRIIDELYGNKPSTCKYWVVRCHARNNVASFQTDSKTLAEIFSLE